MAQMGFHIHTKRCTGCKTCALACKDYYNLSENVAFRQVYEYGGGTWKEIEEGVWETNTQAYYLTAACNHCDAPVCMEVCPTGAMHKADYGLVDVDTRRCIGCGYCELSCPYHVPHVDREAGHSAKCNGCLERVLEGRQPICVEACSLRAIEFGDIVDLRARYGSNADLAPLPSSSQTFPNVIIDFPACVNEQGELPCGMGAVLNTIDIV